MSLPLAYIGVAVHVNISGVFVLGEVIHSLLTMDSTVAWRLSLAGVTLFLRSYATIQSIGSGLTSVSSSSK